MANNQILPKRKQIRLQNYDYKSSGMSFITICCHNYECRFGRIHDYEMELNEFGMIARKMWLDITKVYPNYESKAFQVMPNHLHGIL